MTIATTKTTTALEKFYAEVLQDPVLQERLKGATDPESLSQLAVELGKERNFFFTKEEVLAAMAVEAAMGSEYVEVPLQAGTPHLRSVACAPSPWSKCSAPCSY